jgi:rRNA maturation endonuclease Nob1
MKQIEEFGNYLKGKIISDEIDARWDMCQACEHFFRPTGTCKKCGCFMKLKTKLKAATCPVGKW